MKTHRRKRNKRWAWGLSLFALLLMLLAGTAAWLCLSPTRIAETGYIYVDADDDLDSVTLKVSTIAQPKSILAFQPMAQLLGYDEHIRTGKYAVNPHEPLLTLLRRLRNGEQTPVRLNVPVVRQWGELCRRLSQQLMLDSASIAQALEDSAICAQHGYNRETIPAMFVPNTYEVYWDISLPRLLTRMENEHDLFWTHERLQQADSLGLTPNEVSTLASIVDSETANNAEKPTIAGLYLNRLHQGMLLQSDPTVIFAIGDFTIRRVLNEHLRIDSPYNTYLHTGLPPGPIRIPSIAGIDAVLHAQKHDFLYMCAKEDFSGTHNFAATYQQHLQNARRYVKALNARGIK